MFRVRTSLQTLGFPLPLEVTLDEFREAIDTLTNGGLTKPQTRCLFHAVVSSGDSDLSSILAAFAHTCGGPRASCVCCLLC